MAKLNLWNRMREAAALALETSSMRSQRLRGLRQAAKAPGYTALSKRIDDLNPVEFEKMQRTAIYLHTKSGMARRIVELMTDFIVGTGFSFKTFNNPMLERLLKNHWYDQINRWDVKQNKRCEDLLFLGEQLWPIVIGADSIVRLGSIAPQNIKKVFTSSFDADQVIEVHAKDALTGVTKRYGVIRRNIETGRFEQMERRSETEELLGYINSVDDGKPLDGMAFYCPINKTGEASRGVSELYPIGDQLDALDFVMTQFISRTAIMNKYLLDVTMKGAVTPKDLEARRQEIVDEEDAALNIRIHTENEEWKEITPDLKGGDSTEILRAVRNHIFGCVGIPEHWFAEGGNENLATASVMGVSVLRRLARKQQLYAELLRLVLEFQRDIAIERGVLKAQMSDGQAWNMEIAVISPPLEEPPVKELGTILDPLVRSLSVTKMEGWLDDENCSAIIKRIITDSGILSDDEMDANAREDKATEIIDDQQAERDASDEPKPSDVVATIKAYEAARTRQARKRH